MSKVTEKIDPSIRLAYELIEPYLPLGTVLTIQETDQKLIARYVMRLTYTSKKSGRKMNTTAKGDLLPTCDDRTLKFYTSQLILTPSEVGREFSRLYWLEKRAKQDAWLAAGKHSRREDGTGDIFSVLDIGLKKDKLTFEELA